MKHNEIVDTLQNLIGEKPKQREIAEALGVTIARIGNRASRNSNYSNEETGKIAQYFQVPFSSFGIDKPLYNRLSQDLIDVVNITYRPDAYLSAGYGAYNDNNEPAETLSIDSKLLISDRGIKINPANCEIVNVSGNSMSPEYRHGDRVIIDKSVNEFMDGYIFAFVYCDECYMKEINVIGKRIKCISLNPAYDPFYIEAGEYVKVIGRIVPRVRL